MANRRRKKQDDVVGSLIAFLMLVVFWFSFQFTRSAAFSITAVVIYLCVAALFMFSIRKKREQMLRQSGIHDIDKMDGRQFEFYLEQVFKAQGFNVEVTRAAGDYGADLILKKDAKKIAVQAKRYSKPVGIKAVQEIGSAKNFYGCSEAWVISNRDYTEAAVNLARKNGVRLIDREELISMALRMNPNLSSKPEQVLKQPKPIELSCDRCGKPMVLRKGTKGQFYGCSGYPRCRNTKVV